MASIRIILNKGLELDGVVPETEIALTFAAAKFNSLVSRGGTLSNNFKLAKTANNKEKLSLLDDNRSTSAKPYTLFECDILVDNAPTFTGFARIEESFNYYSLRVFSGVSNFFELVGDKSIRDLNLSVYDHDWTAANVADAQDNDNTEGYVYPNINYGLWTGQLQGSSRDFTEFYPATYLKTLLETAAIDSGYTLLNYDTNFAIPFSLKDFKNTSKLDTRLSAAAGQPITGGSNTPMDLSNTADEGGLISTFNGENVIAINDGSSLEVDVFLSIDNTTSLTPLTVTFGNTTADRIAEVTVSAGDTGVLDFTGTIVGPGLFSFYPIIAGGSPEVGLLGGLIRVIRGQSNIGPSQLIPLADTLPDIKVKDLFLFEAVRQNALIISDPVNNTIEFISINSIVNKKLSALDWSEKVSTVTEPKYEYRLTEYAQNNVLKFKESTEDDKMFRENPNRGRGVFVVNDLSLKPDRDWYTAPFAATGITIAFRDNLQGVAFIPRYSETNTAFLEPDINPQPRIVILNQNTDLINQVTGQAVKSTNANATFSGFDESVTNDYQGLSTIFDRMKLVEVYVRLNTLDIKQLDITRPVYLLNNYWYIREVSQYKVGSAEPTKLKLIRL